MPGNFIIIISRVLFPATLLSFTFHSKVSCEDKLRNEKNARRTVVLLVFFQEFGVKK